MRANDELHKLIHSLTPSEKRYFRLNVLPFSRKAGNLYLRIFDVMLEQGEYDQEAMLEILSKDRPVTRYSAEKKYLYQLILKVMRSYVAENDVYRRIKGMIQDIEYLFDKALYSDCMKLLQKAGKLAEEYDDLPSQLMLLSIERRLVKRLPDKVSPEVLESLFRRNEDLLLGLQTQSRYADFYDRLFLITQRENQLRGKEEAAELKEMIVKSGLDQVPDALSFQSRHLHHQVYTFYYQLNGEPEKALAEYGKLVAHWEAYPLRISENPGKFKAILSNYLGYCQLNNDYSAFPKVIRKIRELPSRNKREEVQSDCSIYYYDLLYHLNVGDLATGMDITETVDAWLPEHVARVPSRTLLGFYHNGSLVYFLSGDFRQALNWVNRILNFPNTDIRKDSLQFARLLQMIIHFELGNLELIESLSRSARRYFKQQDRLYEFEGVFLRVLKKMTRQLPEEWQEGFLELKEMLEAEDSDWPGNEEIRIWVESHLKKKPIAELAMDRNR